MTKRFSGIDAYQGDEKNLKEIYIRLQHDAVIITSHFGDTLLMHNLTLGQRKSSVHV